MSVHLAQHFHANLSSHAIRIVKYSPDAALLAAALADTIQIWTVFVKEQR
jgi:hypothetical protein